MPLVGIIAKKKDIKAIKKEMQNTNIELIEITKDSIKNIKNIKFEEIILLENMNLNEEENVYIKEILPKAKCLIINGDIEINLIKEIDLESTTKLITIGFNSKATITISSVTDEKIIVYIQRNIEKNNGEILETQEKEIMSQEDKKIYNNLAVIIIKELHN